MTDFTQLSANEIADGVRAKKFRATEVAGAHLDRIAAVDGRVKAYLAVTRERALAEAKAVDDAVAAGKDPGPLAGVPVALKDNLCTRGVATTCSSKSLETYVPPYDAHVVERLRAAGAVALGKTNLDEFAMGSSTENSAFGATRNPWDTDRIPGGSSGGSAAAVAARCAALSLGSDTGGSIRQPAALCGITGLKPTYGRVSRYGLIAFASSLDQIGPFSRTVRDAARMLGVVSAPDPRDATCLDRPVPDYEKACAGGPAGAKGLRVGVPKEYFGEGLDPEVRKAVDEALGVYRSLGATVVDVTLPRTKYGIPTYYLVATAEASSNLARYDGVHYGRRTAKPDGLVDLYASSRRESLGAEVKRRIMLGTYALSSGYYDAYYLRALKVRRLIHDEFSAAFAKADVIVGPTSPIPAFKAGEKTADPLQMYLCDIFTVCTNLAGIPGISIPCGFTKAGLPVGLQITARAFDEEMIFRAAAAYEGATEWHARGPAL